MTKQRTQAPDGGVVLGRMLVQALAPVPVEVRDVLVENLVGAEYGIRAAQPLLALVDEHAAATGPQDRLEHVQES